MTVRYARPELSPIGEVPEPIDDAEEESVATDEVPEPLRDVTSVLDVA